MTPGSLYVYMAKFSGAAGRGGLYDHGESGPRQKSGA
jgi:hypothetical protein